MILKFCCVLAALASGCDQQSNGLTKTERAQHKSIEQRIDALGGITHTFNDVDRRTRGLPEEYRHALGYIGLDFVDLTGVDLSPLIPNRTLINASFWGSTLSDEQAKALRTCERLELLILQSTNITDRALEPIGRIPTIKMLHLDRCNVSDKGLEYLANCHSLEKLTLIDTHVTENGIKKLRAALPALKTTRWLTAPSPEVRDALVQLERNGANILGTTAQMVALMKGKGPFRRYSIEFDASWKPCPEGVEWLKILAKQVNVSIGIYNRSPQMMHGLGRIPRLLSLTIAEEAQVTSKDLSSLANGIEIEEVTIQSPLLDAAGFEQLGRIKGLKRLNLQGVPLSKEGLRNLKPNVTLKTIEFSDCDLSSDVFDALLEIPSLREVSLVQCRNVTPDNIKRLRQKRPTLTIKFEQN